MTAYLQERTESDGTAILSNIGKTTLRNKKTRIPKGEGVKVKEQRERRNGDRNFLGLGSKPDR